MKPDVAHAGTTMPVPRVINPSEKLLDEIKRVASRGIATHRIGPALGMTAAEFGALMAQSYDVEDAIDQGRAMGELAMADSLYAAAQAGDAGAAKTLLTHRHGWRDQKDTDTNVIATQQQQDDRAMKQAIISKLSLDDIKQLRQMRERIVEGERVESS